MDFQKVRPVFFGSVWAALCAVAAVTFYQSGYSSHELTNHSPFISDSVLGSKPRLSRKSEYLARQLMVSLRREGADPVVAHLVHTVKRGETLGNIWARFGSPQEGVKLAEQALRAVGSNLHLLRVGEQIALKLSPEKGVVGLTRDLGEGKTLILDSTHTSGYSAQVLETPTVEQERVVSGAIDSSLFAAAAERKVPFEIIDQMVDLLSDKVEFTRDIQQGDTFTMIFSERVDPSGNSLGAPALKAVALTNRGEMLAAVAHAGSDGKLRYFDKAGELLGNYFLRYPLKFSRISSTFSNARFHPILGVRRPHNGVDFAAPIGTAVRSVSDGIIEFAGYNSGGGKTIKIRHDQRYSTAYLHLNSIASGVRKGGRVARGQVIGAVGMTGLATGPHLHFALFDRGTYVNPLRAKLPVLAAGSESIPKTLLAATLERMKAENDKQLLAYAARKGATSHG